MSNSATSNDPRVRRTREMLYRAFQELLSQKSFDEITVQDIADRSTVNRATFYDHFPDKFALLEEMIADNFRMTLGSRMDGAQPGCPSTVRQLVLTVCDYFADLNSRCQKHQRQFAPVVESRIKQLVRDSLLTGLQTACGAASRSNPELRATLASWAICGACLEWSRTKKQSQEDFVEAVLPLVFPALGLEAVGGDGAR